MSSNSKVIDWSSVKEAAKLCANNHAKFDSFMWADRPKDPERYMIFYTSNRDSDLLTKSNEHVMQKELEGFNSVRTESHSHWACGYADCLVIKVFKKDGSITKAFEKLCELQQRLEDYPVLDDEDFSDREYEASIENITNAGRKFVHENAPDNWPYEVFSWLSDNTANACECRDGGGAYPSDDELKEALSELSMLSPEYSPFTLDDFPVGTKVVVGVSAKSSNTLWTKPFSGYVIEHDEDNETLIVQTDYGERFRVILGEILNEWSLDNDDPNQFRLFYYFESTGYITHQEYRKMKEETEAVTNE